MPNLFTEHPKSVGESYFKHLIIAFSFSIKLIFIATKVLIHVFFPFLFKNCASSEINKLNAVLQQRKKEPNDSNVN